MIKLSDHPSVKSFHKKNKSEPETSSQKIIEAQWLKDMARDCGADDVGIVEIERPELDDQREEILRRYPWTRNLLSIVLRMNREPVRSTARSLANIEFHNTGEEVNEICRKIINGLEQYGIRAVSPAMGFPMEMSLYPSRIWVISHKPVAVAAGLGHMGIHRNVIHPIFGNFILLGTVLIDAQAGSYDAPLDYNPCLECNLCVVTCPVGAISANGDFNFTACYTHNYREFMGGFTDWVEQIAESKSAVDYRSRIKESETASFWQSLSFGPNYKSAYCMSVCPAGEDVIGPYLNDRKNHYMEVVRPLQNKKETVYVVEGSDAEDYVQNTFKNKRIKIVGNALRPRSIRVFIDSLPIAFQRGKSEGLNAIYHFTFTGDDDVETTVIIRDKMIQTLDGHIGRADISVTADSQTWLGYLAQEKSLIWALITRKIKIKGSPKLLSRFGKCFPATGLKRAGSDTLTEVSLAKPKMRPFLQNSPETSKIADIGSRGTKWTGILKVDEIIQEIPSVKTFRFVNPPGGDIPFTYQPGQFLTLSLYPEGQHTKRSYTIASSPTRSEYIELSIKREQFGLVSRHMHDHITKDDLISVVAPSGNFTFIGEEHRSIVLLAGGVGITPMMSIVRFLTDRRWGGEIYLIISYKSPEEFIFRNEIEELQKHHPNLRVLVTMSGAGDTDWSGPRGRVSKELINNFVPNIREKRVHICGPLSMMDSVKSMLSELEVPSHMIKLENFGTDKRRPGSITDEELGEVVGGVRFRLSGISAEIRERETLLDVADALGIEIDNACRSGTCGTCKVQLLAGSVAMDCEDALMEDEKSDGVILACQAMSRGDVEIDA